MSTAFLNSRTSMAIADAFPMPFCSEDPLGLLDSMVFFEKLNTPVPENVLGPEVAAHVAEHHQSIAGLETS